METGFGRHVTEVTPGDFRKGLKILYASYTVYTLGIGMIRFSAILFYHRIFELRCSPYRYVIWCSLGLNAAWIIAFNVLFLIPCAPIHAFWDRPMMAPANYSCISTLSIQLSAAITSGLMDLLVLLLPVPRLLKIQTSWRNKVRVGCIFFIGYWYGLVPLQTFKPAT